MDNTIEPVIRERIEGASLYALRERNTKKCLGVSYSPDGLKFTTNKMGKLLCYRNAYLKFKNGKSLVTGDTRNNDRVFIEKFKPINFKDNHLMKCEVTWAIKGNKLLYNSWTNNE